MINNNPYNIPQKPPMTKSKILSQYPFPANIQNFQKRQQNQCLYNSAIFMKKSFVSNNNNSIHQYPVMQESIKVPMSPNHHYKPQSVQFFSSPNQNNIESNKQSYLEKAIKQINQKLSKVNLKLDNHDNVLCSLFEKKQASSQRKISTTSISTFNENQSQYGEYTENFKRQFQQIKKQNQSMKRSISTIQNKFQLQLSQKIIEESKNLFLPIIERMTAIQTTIRQMGQDIHLINDKQQNLTQKIQAKFKQINNQISKIKNSSASLKNQEDQIQKIKGQLYKAQLSINKLTRDLQLKIDEPYAFYNKNTAQIQKLKAQVQQLNFKLKEDSLKTDNQKIENLKIDNQNIRSGFLKSDNFLMLKYLQKFQILNPTLKFVQKQIQINELTYYIDYEGYVLDNQRFYLIDAKGEKVKLNQAHIQLLKNQNILI